MMSFPAVAAEATAKTSATRKVVDVKLNDDGAVLGRLVDRQGKPIANVTVNVASKYTKVATKTNNEGFFAAKGVKSGELALQVANQTQVVRAWDAKMAPPSAAPGALLVVGDAVRGQCQAGCQGCSSCAGGGGGGLSGLFGGGLGGGGSMLASPLVIGAGVAAAIAIPLALDDDDAS